MAFSNTEGFQLPVQNTIESARFVVEKILDTFLAQDNKIYYKVKWQDTWEPEERMMGICAPIINEFWKEYYHRSQSVNLQQSTTLVNTQNDTTKQFQHLSTRSIQANSFTPQEEVSSVNHQPGLQSKQPPPVSHQLTPSTLGQITDVTSPQPHQPQVHQQQSENLQTEQQHQQVFENVSQMLIANNRGTGLDHSLMAPQSINSVLSPSSNIVSTNMHSLQVEFRIQDGNVVEKKNPQFLLQSRISAPDLIRPNIPFLPAFATLHQSIMDENKGQSLDTSSALDKSPKKYICPVCTKEFSASYLLKRHASVHEPPSVHTCPTCNKTFSKKTALRRHELAHKSTRNHLCKICGKGFKERSNLLKHMVIHSGERPHTCDVCDASFRQLGHLLKHTLVHKPDKPFKCEICGKGFKRKEHLKDHMIIHSGDFPFHCDFCDKKFRFKTNLKVHIMQHNGRRDYVCNVCNKAFTGKANLAQHIVVHDPSCQFSCEVCKKNFRRKGHLKRHMEAHRNDGQQTCVLCSEQFLDRSSYKKHLLVHTGSKPFGCSICQKRFGGKSYLKQHMLTHDESNATSFKCNKCVKKFTSQDSLIKHEKLHEVGLICQNCGKNFRSLTNLEKHKANCVLRATGKGLADELASHSTIDQGLEKTSLRADIAFSMTSSFPSSTQMSINRDDAPGEPGKAVAMSLPPSSPITKNPISTTESIKVSLQDEGNYESLQLPGMKNNT